MQGDSIIQEILHQIYQKCKIKYFHLIIFIIKSKILKIIKILQKIVESENCLNNSFIVIYYRIQSTIINIKIIYLTTSNKNSNQHSIKKKKKIISNL